MNALPAAMVSEEKALGAYLGLAVGDALGATVEFMTPREIRTQYGEHREIVGGGWLRLGPGVVTDDTTMSLALGEAILSRKRIDAEGAAEAFDGWMRGRPVDIGNTVRRGILRYRRDGSLEAPPSEYDAGNGACMRVLPVALATLGAERATLRRACEAQARVTHHNPLSDAGTTAIAEMVQMAVSGAGVRALIHDGAHELIHRHPPFHFRGRRCENPSGFIVETLQAVFQAVFDTDTFEQCLIDVVNRGGDADTTGAIAGMLAGARHGIAAIPRRWLEALDPRVRADCERQALALIRGAPFEVR